MHVGFACSDFGLRLERASCFSCLLRVKEREISFSVAQEEFLAQKFQKCKRINAIGFLRLTSSFGVLFFLPESKNLVPKINHTCIPGGSNMLLALRLAAHVSLTFTAE